jgi:hypothetical protein
MKQRCHTSEDHKKMFQGGLWGGMGVKNWVAANVSVGSSAERVQGDIRRQPTSCQKRPKNHSTTFLASTCPDDQLPPP